MKFFIVLVLIYTGEVQKIERTEITFETLEMCMAKARDPDYLQSIIDKYKGTGVNYVITNCAEEKPEIKA